MCSPLIYEHVLKALVHVPKEILKIIYPLATNVNGRDLFPLFLFLCEVKRHEDDTESCMRFYLLHFQIFPTFSSFSLPSSSSFCSYSFSSSPPVSPPLLLYSLFYFLVHFLLLPLAFLFPFFIFFSPSFLFIFFFFLLPLYGFLSSSSPYLFHFLLSSVILLSFILVPFNHCSIASLIPVSFVPPYILTSVFLSFSFPSTSPRTTQLCFNCSVTQLEAQRAHKQHGVSSCEGLTQAATSSWQPSISTYISLFRLFLIKKKILPITYIAVGVLGFDFR